MLRYFVAGNLWLIFAVSAFTGRTVERSDPSMYSIHGMGRWFHPSEFNALLAFLLAMSAIYFLLYWRTRIRTPP